MNAFPDNQITLQGKTIDDRIGDSMLAFGIGIAIFLKKYIPWVL